LVDKHPSFRELRVAAETQSAYRLPICMVVEVVLLAREPKLQRTESLRTKVCLISFRCQAITYEYGRGDCHPANAKFITEPEQNRTVRSVFVIYPKSLGSGNLRDTPTYCTRHHHDAPGVLLGTTRSP
jgi:hypothetical protein